jgi:ABC-type branched-subunit amino acid transport system ATPase component
MLLWAPLALVAGLLPRAGHAENADMIVCQNVNKWYGEFHALKNVSLTVKKREVVVIIGPSGSGKSTLAYTIAGHPKYTVTKGSIDFDGQDVLAMSVDERARSGLSAAGGGRGADTHRMKADGDLP